MSHFIDPVSNRLKQEKLSLLEAKLKHQRNLPHLYAHKWYSWQREFFEDRSRMSLLTAANQVGKSSIQIIHDIEWATNKELWPQLWATQPNQFWYLYPSRDLAHIEYETKWKLYLPRNEYKSSARWGWTPEIGDRKKISAIHFNSGVHLYFKTYAQDASDLQAGTVYKISCDEELPWPLYPELSARLNSTDGYFSMVFTATLGQQELYEAMEMRGMAEERFKDAKKMQVSLYDCQKYEDGTPSMWTEERINRAISRCGTEAEIQRRVFGRFVFSEGRRYPSFSVKENALPFSKFSPALKDIPTHLWLHYVGLDYGSGGASGHPSAIAILGVHPGMRYGRVVRAWRGDSQTTTAHDVVLKYEQMIDSLRDPDGRRIPVVIAAYDWAAADLYNIASRRGLSFLKAEKNHAKGEATINALFKNKMVELNSEDPEQMKLAMELSNLRSDADKKHARDDLVDAFRYASVAVPWDWSGVGLNQIRPDPDKKDPREEEMEPRQLEMERRWKEEAKRQAEHSVDNEIEEWNNLYGT